MRVIRRAVIVCALMAGVSLPIVHGQSPVALADQMVAAGDAERVVLAAAHAEEFRSEKFGNELTRKGADAMRRGEFAVADQYHRAVLWLAEHFNDDRLRTLAFSSLASLNGQRGNYAAAQRYAIDAIALAEKNGDRPNLQTSSANLGIIQRRLGDIDGALRHFDRALALAGELNLPANAARVVNNIGLAYFDLGDMSAALEHYERSLAMKVKLEPSPTATRDIASTLNNIGILYDERGDYAHSLDYYQRAEALAENVGGPSWWTAISNVGHVYLKMGDHDRARERFNRVLALAESQGDRPRVATSLYLLGYLDREAGRYADAEVMQRRSLAIREETGESMPLTESLTELASLATAGGRPAEAYSLASRAASIAAAGRLPTPLWKAQSVAADALAALKRDDEALVRYQASIDAIELLRRQTVGGNRGQQQYLGGRVAPYYGMARLHANAGRPLDGLLAVERARARTLLDVFAGGRRSTRLLTADQRERERELSQTVLSISIEIDSLLALRQHDPAQLTELEGKLSRARLERDAYISALYKAAPDLQIARGEAPVITPEDLSALVKPATAVISLVLDSQQVWVYVITRNSGVVTVTTRAVPVTSTELVKLADQFAHQVATRDLGFADNARKLYDLLFVRSKVEPLLHGKSRLVIVPDGPLWRVPFQALQTPRDTFLIEERAVAYSPSISALASLERRRQSRAAREPHLLALGDPAIAVKPGAPVNGSRKVLGRLPQAAREVTALGKLYGAGNSQVLIGEQATEAALRDQLGRATVVHVATHGILDDLSPMYSHVMLTPATGKNSDSDGRLEAWELIDQPLNVDLAVLSACETARGPVGDGEGVIGLSWSLFAAGASTAVVSQWEVDSASTTALMIAFHERLLLSGQGGRSRSDTPEALRVAAMRLMRGAAYRHPFYWAGFVVIGAW